MTVACDKESAPADANPEVDAGDDPLPSPGKRRGPESPSSFLRSLATSLAARPPRCSPPAIFVEGRDDIGAREGRELDFLASPYLMG